MRRRCTGLTGTAIEIKKEEYTCFTVDSIVDCNNVFRKGIDQIVQKLKMGKLKLKAEMDMGLVERLRAGVLKSPKVEADIKALLSGS